MSYTKSPLLSDEQIAFAANDYKRTKTGSPFAGIDFRAGAEFARDALAAQAAPAVQSPKSCIVDGDCKHGSWCSEVYCQEHCKFVKGAEALDALAELCDMATGGWDLPPSAVERIGAIARKASAAIRAAASTPAVYEDKEQP